jgi:hypothetical protein
MAIIISTRVKAERKVEGRGAGGEGFEGWEVRSPKPKVQSLEGAGQ